MQLLFLAVAIISALTITLFIAYLISPKTYAGEFFMAKDAQINNRIKEIIDFAGGDILALIPEDFKRKSTNNKNIKDLMVRSGNPWNLKLEEFFMVRIMYALLLGIMFAIPFGLLRIFPIFLTVGMPLLMALYGWNYPVSAYRKEADRRNSEFKRDLPEAIDYLAMAMSGGNYSLPTAFEKIIRYLPLGVVREEFERVNMAVASGKPMEIALDELAERAPNDGIKAFVNSLNNANRLSVSMMQLLKNRASTSRKDLIAELDLRIQKLPLKVLAALGPSSIIALLLASMTPVVIQLFMYM